MNKYIIIIWSDFSRCPEVDETIGPFDSMAKARQFIRRRDDIATPLQTYHGTAPKGARACTIQPLTPGGDY